MRIEIYEHFGSSQRTVVVADDTGGRRLSGPPMVGQERLEWSHELSEHDKAALRRMLGDN